MTIEQIRPSNHKGDALSSALAVNGKPLHNNPSSTYADTLKMDVAGQVQQLNDCDTVTPFLHLLDLQSLLKW